MTTNSNGGGSIAPIKPQYIIERDFRAYRQVDDDAAEQKTNPASESNGHSTETKHDENGEPIAKAPKLSGSQRKKLKKQQATEERKRTRGMNTSRKFEVIRDTNEVCHPIARGQVCDRGDLCKYSHSIKDYLSTKPKDLPFPFPPSTSKQGALRELDEQARQAYLDKHYSEQEPFALFSQVPHTTFGCLDTSTCCPVYLSEKQAATSEQEAFCNAGWGCRFLGAHVLKAEEGKGTDGTEWILSGKTPSGGSTNKRNAPDEVNWMDPSLPRTLRSKQYPIYLAKAALEQLSQEANGHKKPESKREHDETDDLDALMNEAQSKEARLSEAEHSVSLNDNARIRPSEKRRLDWFHDELYLAPLTTTGNLPFRRLCVSFGADITCGEMGLADSYLQGSKSEWSLVRRWEGEKCFGTQLCGSKPDLLVPAAEVLAKEFPTGLDFIDINCGCPIDLVYNKGAGSALLDHPGRLGRIVRGMNAVTGDIPITVKLRTGTTSTPTTHKMFPRLKVDWDVAAATLHGRSRQQRYKNTADWTYIKQCTEALRESIRHHNEERPDEELVHPIPIYGNGDVYCWQDYEENKALTGVDGQMLARGALVKPWVFTEIKEKRDWDISSRERLDIIRQLCSYGVTHWGSDSMGVNQTRRFVCEALSFMYRYIPIGLLEHLPVHMHDRPPPFVGRNDLETLLASNNANDWVRITELFLGKAPDNWSFTPKHKSNAYDAGNGGEDQG
ncbi:FMN-linked oxidoreductase [Meira miltonrushii]|uniref:tRNA-dihydrouridine(47) synthase [NAD(P)(+)] n=1 Tax=Meira miltonrushii TaxID=1280837 RepID=A0A316VB38_9BASI|nr:FMN-linked oxidoreductase [Meira miltonrushii]PWN34484.1 FMN-linked oxidoreductase [Meira miltonrushii]